MQSRLLSIVRDRVRNGDITERGLARLTGVSQPHIHNVLKGVRFLSIELADQFMEKLKINTDLLLGTKVEEPVYRPVRVMCGPLGPGLKQLQPAHPSNVAFAPAVVLAGVEDGAAVYVGFDCEMAPLYDEGDMAILDFGMRARCSREPRSSHVVRTPEGPRLRFLRQGEGVLYAATHQTLDLPSRWLPLNQAGEDPLPAILARLVWVSRWL